MPLTPCREFFTHLLLVTLTTFAAVMTVAFLTIPYGLHRHPGEGMVSVAAADRYHPS